MDWRTSVSAIPHGNAGNRRTLAAMSRLAQSGSVDPVVVKAAQDAVRPFPAHSPDSDFAAILADVRRRMRYTHDPLGAEVVKEPRYVIDSTNASAWPEPMDCDDASTLTAAMLGAIGYPTQFATVAVDKARPNEWSHVYVRVRHPDGHWVPLDPIVPEFDVGDEVPEARLTAPRAYHEGADPMMRGMGCGPATTGPGAGMTGLGYSARGMGDAASEKASGNPYYNDPSTWDYGTAPVGSSSGGSVEAWADKLLAVGGGIFSNQTKTAQANAAARIAEANAKAARFRATGQAPGFFQNADGSTNMTKVVVTVGVVGIGALLISKALRRR